MVCSPWGHKKSDTTEHTQKTEANFSCFSRNKVNINFTEIKENEILEYIKKIIPS